MPPASINDLPVELHTSILKFLLCISTDDCFVRLKWAETDTRSPSLFPFNVASVSKLWRDILAFIPECWTWVVLDVAKDPTLFLDVFMWSGSLDNIEVVVFNSNDAHAVDKTRESSRVVAITQALRPHIHCCKSIVYNVTYSTSLPPPTIFFFDEVPHLKVLKLDCCIDDVILQNNDSATIKNGTRKEFAIPKLKELKELSLTGFWFMYLMMHALWPDDLPYFQCKSLFISHSKFSKNGCYSLPQFIFYISRIASGSKYFRELSLSCSYNDLQREYDCHYQISGDIHFQSVSKDLLHYFLDITKNDGYSLSFEACEIPKIKPVQSGLFLTLTNIIDDDKRRSLRNILEVWDGEGVTFCSCPSFNDAFIYWLASEYNLDDTINSNQYTPSCPAEYLTTFTVDNCNNFSSHALKEFVRLRNESAAGSPSGGTQWVEFLDVNVDVTGPVLKDKDKRWFEMNAETTTVWWSVGGEQVFSTEEEVSNTEEA